VSSPGQVLAKPRARSGWVFWFYFLTGGSAEAAVDVVGGARVVRVLEELDRVSRLDDAARLAGGGEGGV